MLLRSPDGTALELRIDGYHFPRVADDPWDSNALEVTVRVVSQAQSWSVTDPCLTTYEAEDLARWLATVAASRPPDRVVRIAGPNMGFRLVGASGDRVRLRAEFDFEERPPWADHGLSVELELTRAALGTAARDLRADLERFPNRADPPE